MPDRIEAPDVAADGDTKGEIRDFTLITRSRSLHGVPDQAAFTAVGQDLLARRAGPRGIRLLGWGS